MLTITLTSIIINYILFIAGPLPESPTIDTSEIRAKTFSNVSLTCWTDNDDFCPEHLFWHFSDNRVSLPESGEKYKVEVKETHTKCKKELILSIFNITKNDEGTISCHSGYE